MSEARHALESAIGFDIVDEVEHGLHVERVDVLADLVVLVDEVIEMPITVLEAR
jgi:hypothetical protein